MGFCRILWTSFMADPFLDLCASIFVLPRKVLRRGRVGMGVRYLKWGGMFFPSSVFE